MKIKILTMCILAAAILSGCSSPKVNSQPGQSSSYPITDNYSLKVADVCYANIGMWPRIIIVIERFDRDVNLTEHFIYEYYDPHYTPYVEKYNSVYYRGIDLKNRDGVLVLGAGYSGPGSRRNRERDLCGDFDYLPVLVLDNIDSVAIPDGMDSAIYAQYQDKNLVSLGYVSKKIFLDNRYNFMIDLKKLSAYNITKREKGNPVYLMDTPVTAALDASGSLVLAPGRRQADQRKEKQTR